MKVSVVIPTRDGGQLFRELMEAIQSQKPRIEDVIVIDTESLDGTPETAIRAGARLISIEPCKFDHGATRNLAGKISTGDIIVYLTQDAVPTGSDSIGRLIAPLLRDPLVGVSYGRQLPRPDASPSAAHLRLFNYPALSRMKSLSDRQRLGIRAAHLSNSFAAYRRSALMEIGWFHEGLIMGEDTVAGAELLLRGYTIAYTAEADVVHSHNYTMIQEMQRYFDVGVFHRTEEVLIREFGTAHGEGMRYARSELGYLIDKGQYLELPAFLLRTALKLAGYKMGYSYRFFPRWLARRLFSMNKAWFSAP